MQTGPGPRTLSQRMLVLVREFAALRVLGVAAPLFAALLFVTPWTATSARAAAHPEHIRPRKPLRQTLVAQTDHASSSGHAARGSSARHSARPATRHSSAKTASDPAKASTHGKTRRRKHQDDTAQPDPAPMHRASAARSRTEPAARHIALDRTQISRPKSEHAAAAQSAEQNTLTVDDFVRAASPAPSPAPVTSPASGRLYVKGESHTEADERLATERVSIQQPVHQPVAAMKPAATKRPAVTSSVEAAEPDDAPSSPLANAEPSDLVGAPIAPANPAPRTPSARNTRADAFAAKLPAPSRQELTEEVLQPVVLPGLYRNGRLVVPAPLKGTREILVHQNTMADDEGLERIQDEDDLQRLRAAHLLVNFPESASLRVNPDLSGDRRCARVWTVRFATDIARGYYARFHQPLQVNSAVRTVAYQVRLQRTNGNAAGIDGETASPHLTGQALDLGKRGMSVAQIAWMRAYLLPLMRAGKLDVEEEFQQACFHISVYRAYMPAAPVKRRLPRNEVAQLREPRVKSGENRDRE